MVNSPSIKKKKKFYLGLFEIFPFENWRFFHFGEFWIFFFQSIQQTKFIQQNALIIIFRFCRKFCFHQHQNCKILPTTFEIQSNLGYRTLRFSTKSVFEQEIQDFYVSDFEQKFGSRPNRKKPSKHECTMTLHMSAFFTRFLV